MNILVVAHFVNGAFPTAIFVHDQALAYKELGHNVKIIVPVAIAKRDYYSRRISPTIKSETVDGIQHVFVRYFSLSRFGNNNFNSQSARCVLKNNIKAILDDFTPDIIQAHTLGFDSECGSLLKQCCNCPLVVTTHGSDTSIPHLSGHDDRLEKWGNKADAIVCVSSKLRNILVEAGVKTPIVAINNGFKTSHIENDSEPKTISLINKSAQASFIINQTGNLIESKRVDVTIRAFAQLHEEYSNAKLVIIGDGPLRMRLESLCKELCIENSVEFKGQLKNDEVLAEMRRAAFFVMPSVNEGFGIVYIEAMSSGCITIGTKGEGIEDVIEDGTNGFLIPADDETAIVNTIKWCIDNPDDAEKIMTNGKTVAKKMTWANNAQKNIDLFSSLTVKRKNE